jgi:hypothetical protein
VQYETEGWKMAMKDTKRNEGLCGGLGQVGRAITISNNSANYPPQPVYARMEAMEADNAVVPGNTS